MERKKDVDCIGAVMGGGSRLKHNDVVDQQDYKNWFHSRGIPIPGLNLHNTEGDIFGQQSDSFFWCNYSQQTFSSSVFRESGIYGSARERELYTRILGACASRPVILITPRSDEARNSPHLYTTNTPHTKINSQGSLKQNLALTSSAHQLTNDQ